MFRRCWLRWLRRNRSFRQPAGCRADSDRTWRPAGHARTADRSERLRSSAQYTNRRLPRGRGSSRCLRGRRCTERDGARREATKHGSGFASQRSLGARAKVILQQLAWCGDPHDLEFNIAQRVPLAGRGGDIAVRDRDVPSSESRLSMGWPKSSEASASCSADCTVT